ncbi:MAG TPA: cysteine hydrolase [Allosphingosinicella sp.]|nr:cysteine hydrolase [Allosphingosinicella sp.]
MKLLSESKLAIEGKLIASKTALVCIHWQNEITNPKYVFGSMFAGQVEKLELVPRMIGLLAFARQRGLTIIFVNVVFDKPPTQDSSNPAARLAAEHGSCLRGSVSAAIVPELGPKPGDIVCEHANGSAFYNTSLKAYLDERGIDTIAINGIATNVAVDHTVRDALTLGYRTLLIEDCCCSSSAEFHDAALVTLRVLAADVVSADGFKSYF